MESKVVIGHIAPIEADKIRMPAGAVEPVSPPKVEPIFITTFVEPGVPTQQTIDHALEKARWVVDNLAELPLNPLTADVIAMSYALIHFAKEIP